MDRDKILKSTLDYASRIDALRGQSQQVIFTQGLRFGLVTAMLHSVWARAYIERTKLNSPVDDLEPIVARHFVESIPLFDESLED